MHIILLSTVEKNLLCIKIDLFRDGVIFFPEFCKVILRKFREDNVEVFGPYMFKVRGKVFLKLSSFTKKTTHFANYYRTFLYDIPQQNSTLTISDHVWK